MPDVEKPEKMDGRPTAGPAAGDSAPEKTKNKEVPPTGASEVEGAEKRTGTREAEKKRSFFQARQERKKSFAEEIGSLREEISSLKAARSPERSDERKSILDAEDPDALLDERFGGEISTLKKDLQEFKQFKRAMEDERRALLENQAEEYVLSRKHSNDPQFREEVRDRFQGDKRLMAFSDFDPMRAAKMAYIETCEGRGVAPDLSQNSLAGRATIARPMATRSAGEQEERSFAEWKRYVREAPAGSLDYTKRLAEMREADKEGRVK